MTQKELDREVAKITGESLSTVARMGFVLLTRGPVERDRQPLVLDGDQVEANREALSPVA